MQAEDIQGRFLLLMNKVYAKRCCRFPSALVGGLTCIKRVHYGDKKKDEKKKRRINVDVYGQLKLL